MQEIQSVVILGAGALGAMYAALFQESGAFQTAVLARGERFERLQRGGFVINGKPCHIPVLHPDQASQPADLILVALKGRQLPEALPDLKRLVGPHTTILSVMNGLDSEEILGAAYGMEKLLYAIVVGIDAVREGNQIQFSNPGKISFGEAENSQPSQRVLRVKAAFDRAGIASDNPVDMLSVMWWKFMINVGVNQASAVLRAPYGVMQTSPDAQAVMNALMREVLALAQAAGIRLGEQDLERWYTVLNTLSPQGKTSMLQDIEAGRRTEVDSFAGKVVELGKRYAVPTPANETLLHILRVLEDNPR